MLRLGTLGGPARLQTLVRSALDQSRRYISPRHELPHEKRSRIDHFEPQKPSFRTHPCINSVWCESDDGNRTC